MPILTTSADNMDQNQAPQTFVLILDPDCLTLRVFFAEDWLFTYNEAKNNLCLGKRVEKS